MTEEILYDVFLSHNSADKEAVEIIAHRLREEIQLELFLDKWHLVPGEPWQEALEEALDQSRTCAVFLGPEGLGTWENEEMRIALDKRANTPDYRVIPVLLPGARLPERGRLPRFLARHTWVDFRPGIDDADAFHRLVCGIQGIAPGPEGVMEAEAVCPFRGLQVFDEEHARFFFGREALTQHLVEQLREDRFLAVIGPSGSGKSSLVRAGLIPQVRGGVLPASDRWPIVLFKPGPHPVETLATRLLPHLDGGADPLAARESLLDALCKDERGLHGAVQVALASASDSLRLLLVVDQLEELFTLCHDESARARFIANLLYASAIAGGQTVAVVTMRADFFGKCAAYPDLAARLAERDVLLGPMSEEELRQAMEGPAQALGLHYEKGLVGTILGDLGDEPGTLPLLQHTLLELWERRRGGWLTTDAYLQIGRVQGALAQRADAIYVRLTPAQQEAARRALLRLTRPGEGTEDTRRRATLAELLPAEGKVADMEAAVRALADARLLTTGKDERGDEIVDVAHEALIRGWPRLQQWIDEDRAGLRTHRRLTEATGEWEENNHDESYLYHGARLAKAEEWAEEHADALNPLEREFLAASRAADLNAMERAYLAAPPVTTPVVTPPPATPPATVPPPMEDVITRLRRHPVKRFDRRTLDQIQYLVIQHSALPGDFPPGKIATYLVENRQWPGIGYHFYVTFDGEIYQTNHLETVCYFAGANLQYNPLGVCICFAGDFTDEVPTAAQLGSGGKLLAFLMQDLHLPIESIKGHKEFVVTQSPGQQWDSGRKWKDMLLAEVRAAQA